MIKSILLFILAMVLSIKFLSSELIVSETRAQNWSNVSKVMFLLSASSCKILFMMWKIFSMQFMSPLLGGIGIISAPMLFQAARAKAEFWLGSPSWTKSLDPPLFESLNMRANSLSIKPLKYNPFILSYFSHRITPSRYVMATTNFATLPPDPQCEPFAVHPRASPSDSFLQMRPRGARAWSAGLNLCMKLTASKKNRSAMRTCVAY